MIQSAQDTHLAEPWVALIAVVVSALIAGGVALWQTTQNRKLQDRLSASDLQGQHELELVRSQLTTLREREQDSSRRDTEFRVERLAPYFDALSAALVESFSTFIGLNSLAKFRGYVPALDRQREGDIRGWLEATERLSRQRVQVLMSVDDPALPALVRRMAELTQRQQDLIVRRNLFFARRVGAEDVRSAHSAYIQVGFMLLLDVRNAVRDTSRTRPHEEAGIETIDAAELVDLLEKSSIVVVNAGQARVEAWTATWSVTTDVLESLNLTFDDFEASWTATARELGEREDVLDVRPIRLGDSESRDYALSVAFASSAQRDAFTETALPALKAKTPVIWVGHVAPREFTSD